MNEYSTDPFHRIKGTQNSPTRAPALTPSGVADPLTRPYQQTTVTITNHSAAKIATYDNLGLRVIHQRDSLPFGGFVRVQVSYKLVNAAIDEKIMSSLMPHVSKDHIMAIHSALAIKGAIQNTVVLHWDIPLELIQANLNGVLIEPLSLVVQLAKHPNRTHLFHAWERSNNIPDAVINEMTGIMTQFNKHDIAVDGVWINYTGVNPTKLCNNQKDSSKPEGLTVVMNGESQFFTIEEMRSNGYYMSWLTASSAHSSSASEMAAIQKIISQERKDAQERQAKEDDKRYERVTKEEDKQWDRAFKLDERTTRIDDKQYDRGQTLIDKRPIRRFSMLTPSVQFAATFMTAILVIVRGGMELNKVYQQSRGE